MMVLLIIFNLNVNDLSCTLIKTILISYYERVPVIYIYEKTHDG